MVALGITAFIPSAPAAPAAAPTVRLSLQRSTEPFLVLRWGPPQATLLGAPLVTSKFEEVVGAISPYRVDTRLARQGYFDARWPSSLQGLFIWRDTILQPGKVALEWAPRDQRLQESKDGFNWQNTAGVPATDWYFPPIPMEAPAGPVKVVTALRMFRTMPGPGAATSHIVPPPDIVGFVRLTLQVGRPNYFSYLFRIDDLNLNELLQLPETADGTSIQFYDFSRQVFDLPLTFDAERGWLDADGDAAQWRAGELACAILPRTSIPGATTMEAITLGFVQQEVIRRVLPAGVSLQGPLFPRQGGITTVHQLRPNPDDQVRLYNAATGSFDTYEFLGDDIWLPTEPFLGPGDAFFYVNTSGLPLDWIGTF